MKICGIYGIQNTITNKIYVGQSIDIYHRWNKHFDMLEKRKHFNQSMQADYIQFGKSSFETIVLEQTRTLYSREIYWMFFFENRLYNKIPYYRNWIEKKHYIKARGEARRDR